MLIFFIDDLFTFEKDRAYKFAKLVKEELPPIEWQCLSRVDTVTPDLLNKMAEAGCNRIYYGIESGNQTVLKDVKGITIEEVENAVKSAKGAGIATSGFFMLALPGDTKETMQETITFSLELDLDEAIFFITTPFPGTRLWDILERKSLVDFNRLDLSKAFYCGTDDMILFNLSNATDDEVLQMFRKANLPFLHYRIKIMLNRKLGKGGRLLYAIVKPIIRIKLLRTLARNFLKVIRV